MYIYRETFQAKNIERHSKQKSKRIYIFYLSKIHIKKIKSFKKIYHLTPTGTQKNTQKRYFLFNRKITQRVCIYRERHSKQKSKRIYIFYLSEAFFHAKATKAFFTKNIYITMAFFWKYISAFSTEMYKKIY